MRLTFFKADIFEPDLLLHKDLTDTSGKGKTPSKESS